MNLTQPGTSVNVSTVLTTFRSCLIALPVCSSSVRSKSGSTQTSLKFCTVRADGGGGGGGGCAVTFAWVTSSEEHNDVSDGVSFALAVAFFFL